MDDIFVNSCLCGCGGMCKNRYMWGHNRIHQVDSDETRQKRRESQKGRIVSEATKQKIREKRKLQISLWLDKKMSAEHRQRLSASHMGKTIPEEQRIKIRMAVRTAKRKAKYHTDEWYKEWTATRNSAEVHEWRQNILARDDFTCQICRKRGVKLHVDHIKSFYVYPDLRFDLSNGRTLCIWCHRATPTYGARLKSFMRLSLVDVLKKSYGCSI